MHRTEGEYHESNQFTNGPPGTVVDADWLTSIQEELCSVIEGAGLAVSTRAQDSARNQLYQAIQSIAQKVDYTVYNQTTFEALFTRTGANSYDINSNYRSVYFRNIGSGYSFQNVLSGGDTWGDILTRSCSSIEFENGAYINFGDFPGALEVETDDCFLKNVDLRGEGTAAAVTESYRLNAHRVTFDNCKTSSRNSNVDYIGFEGSGTALHNITSKYINCTVYDIDGSDKIYGFADCMNLSNCVSYDIDGTVDSVAGFHGGKNLSSCIAYDLTSTSGSVSGFSQCDNISSCTAEDIEASAGSARGFGACNSVSSSEATTITATDGAAYGMVSCTRVAGAYVVTIAASGGAAQKAYGFSGCSNLSSSAAGPVEADGDAAGFDDCDRVSGCNSVDIDCSGANNAYGFNACNAISACRTINIASVGGTAEGFKGCNYGSSLDTNEATNSGNDWIDSVDAQITNKVSTPSVFT